MPSLLQFLPPNVPFNPLVTRAPPHSPPPHDSHSPRSRRFTLFAAAKSKTKTGREDDYHSTLKALNSRGRVPRKSLGQYYMLNSSVNEQLASVADVKEGDLVLEIGPGTGSLTNVLVDAGAKFGINSED